MRFLVLFIGFVASVWAGLLGYLFYFDFENPLCKQFLELIGARHDLMKNMGMPLINIGSFLMIGGIYGLFACLLLLLRCGWQAGILLLLAGGGPFLFCVVDVQSFIFLFPLVAAAGGLIVSGLFSFLVKPVPVPV